MQVRGKNKAEKAKDARAFRCCCGSLLARLVPEGIELKCRRCKRQIIIPTTHATSEAVIDHQT